MRIFKKDGHTDCSSKAALATRSEFRLVNGLEIPDYKDRVIAQSAWGNEQRVRNRRNLMRKNVIRLALCAMLFAL
jgi:hypothetical protein